MPCQGRSAGVSRPDVQFLRSAYIQSYAARARLGREHKTSSRIRSSRLRSRSRLRRWSEGVKGEEDTKRRARDPSFLAGFTLDAQGRKVLLRYVLRPPISRAPVEQRPDRLVRITSRRPTPTARSRSTWIR